MVTNERLKQLADVKTICVCLDEEYQEMAAELLRLRQQLSEPVASKGNWVRWDGGDCPLAPTEKIDGMSRDGEISYHYDAWCFDWVHTDSDEDLVAYRICN